MMKKLFGLFFEEDTAQSGSGKGVLACFLAWAIILSGNAVFESVHGKPVIESSVSILAIGFAVYLLAEVLPDKKKDA